MTAMTTAGCTPSRELGLAVVLLAAASVALEGSLCFVSATGYGSSTIGANQTVLGVWDTSADNSAGAAGATYAMVRRNRQFLMFNDTATPVVQADLGKDLYAVDNQTVSSSSNSSARPKVGRFMGFDKEQPTMIWVEIA